MSKKVNLNAKYLKQLSDVELQVAEGRKGHVWCPRDDPLSDEPQPNSPAVEMSLRLVAYNGKVAKKFDEIINDEVDVRKKYFITKSMAF
jgi:hypothetical protein